DVRRIFVGWVAAGEETAYRMDLGFPAFWGIRMKICLEKIGEVLALCGLGSRVFAQEGAKPVARETKQSLFKAQHFEQAAISPDGKRVSWVETLADGDGAPTGKQDIFVQQLSAADKPVRVTAGEAATHFS